MRHTARFVKLVDYGQQLQVDIGASAALRRLARNLTPAIAVLRADFGYGSTVGNRLPWIYCGERRRLARAECSVPRLGSCTYQIRRFHGCTCSALIQTTALHAKISRQFYLARDACVNAPFEVVRPASFACKLSRETRFFPRASMGALTLQKRWRNVKFSRSSGGTIEAKPSAPWLPTGGRASSPFLRTRAGL
jgi:hypothetical protein